MSAPIPIPFGGNMARHKIKDKYLYWLGHQPAAVEEPGQKATLFESANYHISAL